LEFFEHGILEGQRFLTNFPSSRQKASVAELLGDLYRERGEGDRITVTPFLTKSLDYYQQAEDIHEGESEFAVPPLSLLTKQGDVQMSLGKYTEAEALYQQVLASARLTSGTPEVITKLAKSLLRQGKFHESAKLLERLLDDYVLTEEQESRALYILGDDYYESKRYDVMMDAYGRAVQLEDLVAADEDMDPMRAHMRITNFLYFAQGKYDDAIRQYEAALKKYPYGRYRFRALYCLGKAYAAKNDLGEAARYFSTLISENAEMKYVDPAYLKDTYFKLGRIYFQMKDYPKAVRAYNSLLDRYPRDPLAATVFERIGDCYAQLALWAKAEESYWKVLNDYPEAPNWSMTVLKLGALKERLSDFTGAAEVYDRVQRRDPGDPLAAEGEYRRIEMGLKQAVTEGGSAGQRRYQSILDDARDAQLAYPDDVRFFSQEGIAAYSLKDFTAAADSLMKYLDKAGDLEKIPHNTFLLGDSLYRLGSYEEAAAALQKRVDQPGDKEERANALFLMARCYKQMGRLDDAILSLDEILTRHPDSPFVPEASAERSRLDWSNRNTEYLQGVSSNP